MKYSDWRYEINLQEFGNFANAAVNTLRLGNEVTRTGIEKAKVVGAAARKIGKAVSGRQKTDSQKRIIKTGGIKAARDMDGDGKLERKRRGGDFQETLLYDVVHDYIIAENFASDTEGANKVMLKLSDELMQEIYERTMTASEKRKDTMLKKKYDDSDMKKNMQAQYGKEEGKKVYFATIRKQAMKKEEVEVVNEVSKKTLSSYVKKAATEIGTSAMKGDYKKMQKRHKGVLDASDKLAKEEVIPEAKVDTGKSDASKINTRNQRAFGNRRGQKGGGHSLDDMEARRYNTEKGRGVKMKGKKDKTPVNYHKRDSDKRVDALLKGMKEEVGITTHSMMMKNKAKKEAMIRMKEREAVAKKLRKEERDEYGDPVGGPKISKKQKEKNLKANTPDEQHTTTTSEGYGSDRVGPALTMARVVDKVNPRPKPNSKRTRISRALKMASIKKDEKIRKRQENPYSADKRLKMVATSIRDRVKQKAKAMTTREDYIPEEGYDIARDMGKVKPSKDKKDGTTMPPSPEMKKTQKVNKGPSAFERVKKKYGKAVMVVGKK